MNPMLDLDHHAAPSVASGSEVHLSGVQNPWRKANRSFLLDVILTLGSDLKVAGTSKLISPDRAVAKNVK